MVSESEKVEFCWEVGIVQGSTSEGLLRVGGSSGKLGMDRLIKRSTLEGRRCKQLLNTKAGKGNDF